MDTTDKRRGTLFGLAIGDALGAAVEFRQPGGFPLVTCYRGGGAHNIDAGMWTDDTSMALALADSIGEKGWNLNDQMLKYVEWWQEGKYAVNGWCFDIGGTVRDSLSNFMEGKIVAHCSDPSEGASGNGSIMRLAPVPIKYFDLYPDRIRELATIADDSSRTTHASKQCRSACRYMAVALAALINGEERERVLSPDWPVLDELHAIEPFHQEVYEVIRGSYRSKVKEICGSGWVVQSLEAALWAFHDAKDFEEAVLRAVNLGNDADTTGAVCGQFAGAYWGQSGIPAAFIDGLARPDMINKALDSLGVRDAR